MKAFLKIIISVIVLVTSLSNSGLTVAQDDLPKFICLTYSDQNKVLLTWEKLPFVEGYEIHKDGNRIFECDHRTTQFIDGDIAKNKNSFSQWLESDILCR